MSTHQKNMNPQEKILIHEKKYSNQKKNNFDPRVKVLTNEKKKKTHKGKNLRKRVTEEIRKHAWPKRPTRARDSRGVNIIFLRNKNWSLKQLWWIYH